MKKIKKIIPLFLSCFFGIIIFSIIHTNMLSSPIRGIADQGDFERMMTWIGVSYADKNDADKSFHWVKRQYIMGAPHVSDVYSSEIPLLFIARYIHVLIGKTTFDINVLGYVHTLLFSFAIALTAYYLQKMKPVLGYLFMPFALLVFTDSTRTAYFNSFYQESSGILFFFFTLAVIGKTITDTYRRGTNTNLALYCVSSLLLISAKAQYWILCVPVVCSLFMLFTKSYSRKLLAFLSMCIVMFSVSFFFLGTPQIIKRWNVYNSVFPQILSATNNQGRAAGILGLEPKFLKYAGIYAAEPNSGINDPELDNFLTVTTFPRIIIYYVLTPRELLSVTKEIIRRSFTSRISYLGYYQYTDTQRADTQPSSVIMWSTLKERTLVHYRAIFLCCFVGLLLLALDAYIRKKSLYSIPMLFILLTAFCQCMIVAFSEGVSGGVEKLLFLFDICVDLLVFITGSTLYLYIKNTISKWNLPR